MQADHAWVVRQTHHLVVAGVALAHLRVSGIDRVAVAIARLHIQYALHTHKNCFGAPKAATAQGDDLGGLGERDVSCREG